MVTTNICPVIAVAAALFMFAGIAVQTHAQQFEYATVIDAGSSGTRVYVFRWPRTQDGASHREGGVHLVPDPLSIEQLAWRRQKPGLSALVEDAAAQEGAVDVSLEAAVGSALEPLLDFAVAHVPDDQLSRTRVFLGATAGLRLLDPISRNRIIEGARVALHASPFTFFDQDAGVISGQREALFMWTSSNLLLKRVGRDPDLLVAALDLGGASTQVSLPHTAADGASPSSVTASPDVLRVCTPTCHNHMCPADENRQCVDLFAASLLGFGKRRAFESYLDWFVQTSPIGSADVDPAGTVDVRDDGDVRNEVMCPCLLPGQREVVDGIVVRGPADVQAGNVWQSVYSVQCLSTVRAFVHHHVAGSPEARAMLQGLEAYTRHAASHLNPECSSGSDATAGVLGSMEVFGFDNYAKDSLALFSLNPPRLNIPYVTPPPRTGTKAERRSMHRPLNVVGDGIHGKGFTARKLESQIVDLDPWPSVARVSSTITVTPTQLQNRAKVVCSSINYRELLDQMDSMALADRAPHLCFQAAYIPTLLELYGLNGGPSGLTTPPSPGSSTCSLPVSSTTFARDIKGSEANWPLGYLAEHLDVIRVLQFDEKVRKFDTARPPRVDL